MATAKPVYASAATITLTLTSLTNGSYRQSTVVDNTTTRYEDAILGGSIQTGTTPTVNTTLEVYLYGTFDGTNYTAGASGTDGAYTADGEELLLRPFEIIQVDATSDQDYVYGPGSVKAAFGGVMPIKWGVVVKNASGVTTNATGTNNITKFTGVNTEIV